jgi:2,4-dienoyl-CoA reductase-like NADH-dependent reductase (Old Yellow Enzyme family)
MKKLFEPLKLGSLTLKNRIIMAPLTRSRCFDDLRIPNDLMVEYYTQRASAGLIISEATVVDPMGVGYARTPGIWSNEQVEGWKKITQAIHNKEGKIFLQLWHVGRISHPLKTPSWQDLMELKFTQQMDIFWINFFKREQIREQINMVGPWRTVLVFF